MSVDTFPIANRFRSPQGEGRNTGMLMQFIRFAGCTVGKPFPKEAYYGNDALPIYTEQCTTYDGRKFACDTDYRVKERMTVTQLVDWASEANIETVLFTGGEPLMHKLEPLMVGLKQIGMAIHVETSGTIKPDLNEAWWRMFDWICVSPKKGFLDVYADMGLANEFKLLVDEDFNWRDVPESIKRKSRKISLSPVNDEHTINQKNMQRCLELQRQHPLVRLTQQSHKIWGVE